MEAVVTEGKKSAGWWKIEIIIESINDRRTRKEANAKRKRIEINAGIVNAENERIWIDG